MSRSHKTVSPDRLVQFVFCVNDTPLRSVRTLPCWVALGLVEIDTGSTSWPTIFWVRGSKQCSDNS